MKQVSGATSFETTIIVNLSLNGLQIEDIPPGSIMLISMKMTGI